MIEEIRKGLFNFQHFTYKKYEKLYQDLQGRQSPHTLFIACSDSRVSPEILTDSEPGEVFTIRNIANTVPSFESSQYDLTTVSAIEYAVEVLNVKEIIICGHSNCGGCAAALSGPDQLSHLPYTRDYLKPLEQVRQGIEKIITEEDLEKKATLMEQMNVVEQLKHLKEYPSIMEKVQKGGLELEGWHYDIGTGQVHVYDESSQTFIDSALIDSDHT